VPITPIKLKNKIKVYAFAPIMDYIRLLLMFVSAIAWTLVYINCIRIGFHQKTYCIPLWALSLNFAWEAWHGFYDLHELGLQLQVIINAIWALFDAVILYTFFRFGKRYFPKNLKSGWFYSWGITSLGISFLVQYAFVLEFGTVMGGSYAAFLQNLLMSVLFIVMLQSRNGSEGQSLTIAYSKCIGTLAPTILFGLIGSEALNGPNRFVLIVGLIIFMFDVVYIVLLRKARKPGSSIQGISFGHGSSG
jgi:hypothetical protein